MLAVNETVLTDDRFAVQLEGLSVYPNGFAINVLVLMNPHLERTGPGMAMFAGGGTDPFQRFPRIGVRFADGRTAGRNSPGLGLQGTPKDEDGFPTEPVLSFTGGGGGSRGYHFGVWVHPLPPDGPLEIYLSLPGASDHETKTTLDGTAVRAAADHATVVWT